MPIDSEQTIIFSRILFTNHADSFFPAYGFRREGLGLRQVMIYAAAIYNSMSRVTGKMAAMRNLLIHHRVARLKTLKMMLGSLSRGGEHGQPVVGVDKCT